MNFGSILTLTGPTAVGKTEISLQLAERLNAEIISVDSRQIYRQLNIGTAKPDRSQLHRIPHHFVDELDLETGYSAGQFAREAAQRIQDIIIRGFTPLIVGGSTLYLQALQFGLADIPAIDPQVRRRLSERLASEGAHILYQELLQVDAATAGSMDASKSHRLIRALEVYHGTGKPLSSYYKDQIPSPYKYRTLVLWRSPDSLNERISSRIDAMLREGLVREVEDLLNEGYDPQLNALKTIGYKEPVSFLQGDISYDEMASMLKSNTKKYAKRQMTWFRRFSGYEWAEVDKFWETYASFSR